MIYLKFRKILLILEFLLFSYYNQSFKIINFYELIIALAS